MPVAAGRAKVAFGEDSAQKVTIAGACFPASNRTGQRHRHDPVSIRLAW